MIWVLQRVKRNDIALITIQLLVCLGSVADKNSVVVNSLFHKSFEIDGVYIYYSIALFEKCYYLYS